MKIRLPFVATIGVIAIAAYFVVATAPSKHAALIVQRPATSTTAQEADPVATPVVQPAEESTTTPAEQAPSDAPSDPSTPTPDPAPTAPTYQTVSSGSYSNMSGAESVVMTTDGTAASQP